MTDIPIDPSLTHYEAARVALQRSLAQFSGCSDEEKDRLFQDLSSLEEMQTKLESGRVDIVVFGEISTGKSALINAIVGEDVAPVSVRGGSTRETTSWEWDKSGYTVPGFASSRIHIIDTPGINEVDGTVRARLAQETSARADLILFVTDSDLNSREHEALAELAQANKPMLLVFNKTDLYTPEQRARLIQVLSEERVPNLIRREDIIETAADPMMREYVVMQTDGSERTEMRKPAPKVDKLKERILALLQLEGKALIALNASLFAADTSDRIAALKIQLRDEYANKAIWSYAVVKSVAVAVNPVPVADILGGTATDIAMVMHLAKIYGIEMSREKAWDLVKSIMKVAGGMVAIQGLTLVATSLFKGLTLGAGTLVTALPQGAVAGWGSYVVGQASKAYFENGASWGEEGPKKVVQRILETTDKGSIMERLKEEIQKRIRVNPYGRSSDG